MMSRMLITVALHSISPLLLFGLSVVIARWWGPNEQGAYAAAKSWLDLLVAIGCFGFPQSVILAINRAAASRSRLYVDAARYALVLPLVFVPAAVLLQTGDASTAVGALAFSIGAAGIVLSNIWRGILLTVTDGLRFNLITITPAIALTVAVAVVLWSGSVGREHAMAYACAAAGLLTLLISVFIFPPSEVRPLTGQVPAYRPLITNGADVFVQAVAMALQTYVCYVLLNKATGIGEVGRFSIALMAFQACLLPLQMVSPLVFNRWSRQTGLAALDAGQATLRRLFMGVLAFVALSIAVIPWIVPTLLGVQFEATVPASQIALLAVVPAFVGRIAALRLAAVGAFRANSLSSLVRLVVVLGALWLMLQVVPDSQVAVSASICWLLGEGAATAVTLLALRARMRERTDELRAA